MAKERYLQELEDELKKKNEYESRIKELEEKENELIEILQNTNNAEVQALDGLKKVLNGDSPDFFDDSINESQDYNDESIRVSNTYQHDDFKF